MIDCGGCARCIQERWPVKPGDEIPLAVTIINGEGLCLEHLAPPTVQEGDPVIERLARHLRKNFVPGTTDVPWRDAGAEEQDVWLTEAAHFLEVAMRSAIGWTVMAPVPVPVSPMHPSVMRLPDPEFVEHGNPGDDKVYTERRMPDLGVVGGEGD